MLYTSRGFGQAADVVSLMGPDNKLVSALDQRTSGAAIAKRIGKIATRVTVVDSDTLDAAEAFVKDVHKRHVAVLNMANDRHPGGGVDSGCGAQEENIFRRSALFMHLNRRMYPIGPTTATVVAVAGTTTNTSDTIDTTPSPKFIYSRSVAVFRNNEHEKYSLKTAPYFVDVITLAGLYCPDCVTIDGKETLKPEDAKLLRNKLRLMFRVAAAEKRDTLVLSALGCGAWRCPPEPVAIVFKEVLHEFDGLFRDVQFAILSTAPVQSTAGQSKGADISASNLATFRRILTPDA